MAARKKTAESKEPARKNGRPVTAMTPENIEAILRTISMGLHPDRAAESCGVCSSTFRAHKRRNPSFATKVKEAIAEAEKTYLGRILMHMDKQWTACAWLLERRFPERWRKRDGDDMPNKISVQPVKDQKDMHALLMDMVSATVSGKITPKQLKDVAQSLGIASDISERADLEERIRKLEGNG